MAYAKVSDLEERFRGLDSAERKRADVLLGDASAMLDAEFMRCSKSIDPKDDTMLSCVSMVCCSMVKRVMANGTDGDLTQKSVTAGSYTEQVIFANASGDMYITKQERRMLGIPTSRFAMASVMPKIGGTDEG